MLAGTLRLYASEGVLDYGPGQYVVPAFGSPRAGQLLAAPERGDFLALSRTFTPHDVLAVLLELEGNLAERIAGGQIPPAEQRAADESVLAAVGHLFSLLEDPNQLAFMARHLLQEILFHVLRGSQGTRLLNGAINGQGTDGIYAANIWIKEHFRQPFTVEELAERKNMSVSRFHQRFKSAVGMGPLQCQKRLWLTEARRLMLDEGKNVTEAALEVGYESVSQFIRDYRKLYGTSPREDIRRPRNRLEK